MILKVFIWREGRRVDEGVSAYWSRAVYYRVKAKWRPLYLTKVIEFSFVGYINDSAGGCVMAASKNMAELKSKSKMHLQRVVRLIGHLNCVGSF